MPIIKPLISTHPFRESSRYPESTKHKISYVRAASKQTFSGWKGSISSSEVVTAAAAAACPIAPARLYASHRRRRRDPTLAGSRHGDLNSAHFVCVRAFRKSCTDRRGRKQNRASRTDRG